MESKQLEKFKELLIEQGFTIKVNWKSEAPTSTIQHCTIINLTGHAVVLFHVYELYDGFDIYFRSTTNDMQIDIEKIKQVCS